MKKTRNRLSSLLFSSLLFSSLLFSSLLLGSLFVSCTPGPGLGPDTSSTTDDDGGSDPGTFVSRINDSTANNEATLGLVGTAAVSSDTSKATVVIDAGKIKITSVAAGSVTITVSSGVKSATIPVTVSGTGVITIGTIVKYTPPSDKFAGTWRNETHKTSSMVAGAGDWVITIGPGTEGQMKGTYAPSGNTAVFTIKEIKNSGGVFVDTVPPDTEEFKPSEVYGVTILPTTFTVTVTETGLSAAAPDGSPPQAPSETPFSGIPVPALLPSAYKDLSLAEWDAWFQEKATENEAAFQAAIPGLVNYVGAHLYELTSGGYQFWREFLGTTVKPEHVEASVVYGPPATVADCPWSQRDDVPEATEDITHFLLDMSLVDAAAKLNDFFGYEASYQDSRVNLKQGSRLSPVTGNWVIFEINENSYRLIEQVGNEENRGGYQWHMYGVGGG